MSELEQRMESMCVGSTDPTHPCVAAIHEHFRAGGARLRARICLEASIRLGLGTADAMQLAACCELLHNASLIQDDLVDRTTMRRGHPSVWAAHGDSVALCAGDLMLSAAYAALSTISDTAWLPSVLALVHARAGEVMLGQAAESKRQPTPADAFDEYQRLAIGKSASLLSLALELPLLVAGRKEVLPVARVTAASFAIAYQIADDIDDQVEDAREGSLNIVALLEQDGALSHAHAEHAAATRALASLAAAISTAIDLPGGCAAVLVASAQTLHSRLSAIGSCLSAPVASFG